MPELAPDAIGALPLLPKPIAPLLLEGLEGRAREELMGSMGESALPAVGASSEFREVFAQLCFVFGRVGARDAELIVVAIALGGGARYDVAGFLVDFEHYLYF